VIGSPEPRGYDEIAVQDFVVAALKEKLARKRGAQARNE